MENSKILRSWGEIKAQGLTAQDIYERRVDEQAYRRGFHQAVACMSVILADSRYAEFEPKHILAICERASCALRYRPIDEHFYFGYQVEQVLAKTFASNASEEEKE